MPANIEEGVQLTQFVFNNKERVSGNSETEVVSRGCESTLVRDEEPVLGKDCTTLELIKIWR
jgi:hypothetical protein